jgi:hypothetical protein
METIERAAIDVECTRLFNEFCWRIDAFDYDGAIDLFVPDCTFTRVDEVFEGTDGVRTVLERRDQNRTTLHLCTNIVIDVVDRDTATGKTYVTVFGHIGPLKAGEEAPLTVPDSIVRNDAEFTRTDAGWRFASLKLGLMFRKPSA